jgi:hypothetical protein
MQAPHEERHVILFQDKVQDPRSAKDPDKPPPELTVRVVLRNDGNSSHVRVEIEDGLDALDQTTWYRLDFNRSDDPAKNLTDARAAYTVLQDVVATLYKRSRMWEKALGEATSKVKELQARLQANILRPKQPAKPPTLPDPYLREKSRFHSLLKKAADKSSTEEERHTCAKLANEMLEKHDFLREFFFKTPEA